MKTWAALLVLCGVGFLACGCGASNNAPAMPAAPANTLAGNWLIAGSMPSVRLSPTLPQERLRLALTIDEVGGSLVAAGFGNHVCTGFLGSFSFPGVLIGTAAKDGSFSLGQATAFPDITIAMTGKAPASAGSPWQGSYTLNFASLPGSIGGCVETLADTFTATYFPLVSGVYTSTATTTTSVNGVITTTTMPIEITLQQGGTATNAITGRTVMSNTVLTGSIKIQGSPCFSFGTTTTTGLSSVLGSQIGLEFTMDDGSTLQLTGSLIDASESRIATSLILIRGGQCGGNTGLPAAYRLSELVRQM